ncbi:hypothetical protein D0869_04171 [Hortaea werneckii]|uniref:Zn(2)-C6 fungal-type domain-containing protein n=1 Tax=Hortaea werneckii TaxID=91943 RepID=A0A3M7A9D3_HORWE|nr:hypothetical protein D0869_04171 [Hortaea werneckii]RMY24057.1 hypothetical protein D0866_11493 [Hortaea werneckii]
MISAKVPILPLRRAQPPPSTRDGAPGNSISDGLRTSIATARETNKPKLGRTSKPKARTGCSTCKIRRVKCDEAKPECNRCTSTGRKCDGYEIPPRRNRALAAQTASSPQPCLEVARGTQDELRALEFFHVRTAPGLSSYFDADFWTRLVFQISSAEPSIRHAMVAVGALHLQREKGTVTLSMDEKAHQRDPLATSMPVRKPTQVHEDPFALVQYNKAIVHLAKRLQDPTAATEIALLACILFVCIEFLRGEAELAINHFKSGMGIAIHSLNFQSRRLAKPASERLRNDTLPFFNRLELLSTLFGNDAPWEYPVALQYVIPEEFANVKEARDSLVHLMNLSLRFIRYMKYRKYDRIVLPDDLARQQTLHQHVMEWEEKFDTLLANDISLTAKDLDATKILRVHQRVMHIWLLASTQPEECRTDVFTEQFEDIVSLGEALQTEAGTCEQRQEYATTFLFDMVIVSPMYFVATKCRHPQIRRRAIKLLRHTKRRESLWDSNVSAAIAERVVAIEEQHLPPFSINQFPAEKHRIHNSHIQSVSSEDATKHAVTFYSKPYGIDAQWKIWQESIFLDPPSNIKRRKKVDRYLLSTGNGGAELSMLGETQSMPSAALLNGWDACSIDM